MCLPAPAEGRLIEREKDVPLLSECITLLLHPAKWNPGPEEPWLSHWPIGQSVVASQGICVSVSSELGDSRSSSVGCWSNSRLQWRAESIKYLNCLFHLWNIKESSCAVWRMSTQYLLLPPDEPLVSLNLLHLLKLLLTQCDILSHPLTKGILLTVCGFASIPGSQYFISLFYDIMSCIRKVPKVNIKIHGKSKESWMPMHSSYSFQYPDNLLLSPKEMQDKFESWLGSRLLKGNVGHFAQKCPAWHSEFQLKCSLLL